MPKLNTTIDKMLYLAYAITVLKQPGKRDLEKFTGLPDTTIKRYINNLKDTHGIFIEFTGPQKTGYYEITKWEGTRKKFVMDKFED